ncbi:MAG: hypothetical protein AB7K24_07245 [Gemmataceae bacterium]
MKLFRDKYPFNTLEMCRFAGLRRLGRELLARADLTPPAFFELLMSSERRREAIRFFPHLVPKRAAVWWGCLCLWQIYRPEPPQGEADLFWAASQWSVAPSEVNRQAAAVKERELRRTPAGCLALAAHWSGGSMGPSHFKLLPPPPYLTAKLTASAVTRAIAKAPTSRIRQQLRRDFLVRALEVARGENLFSAEIRIHRHSSQPVEAL